MLDQRLNNLSRLCWTSWSYYPTEYEDYQHAIADPEKYIQDYFSAGGKMQLLTESIISDSTDWKDRSIHMVNAYFLGLYLLSQIEEIQFRWNGFLESERNYLWAWFLCALYHDAFYNFEQGNQENYQYDFGYFEYSKRLLFPKQTLIRYGDKENNRELCHNIGETHLDHGLVAASSLYVKFMNVLQAILCQEDAFHRCQEDALHRFLADEDVNYYHGALKINRSLFMSVCKIAKVIACHNIYICSDTDQAQKAQYHRAKLDSLIVSNPRFKYLPQARKSNQRTVLGEYEKLYFLLALVDTLEPTKRGIPMDRIEISIIRRDLNQYVLSVDTDSTNGENARYYRGLESLKDWLNFVSVTDNGHTITIDFQEDKNRR